MRLQPRTPSRHQIRLQGALAFHRGNRETVGFGRVAQASVPTESPAWPINDLTYVNRRVLRIIAATPDISLGDLGLKADLGLSDFVRPYADELVLYGLVSRDGMRYAITRAGMLCLRTSRATSDQALASGAAAWVNLFDSKQPTGEQAHG